MKYINQRHYERVQKLNGGRDMKRHETLIVIAMLTGLLIIGLIYYKYNQSYQSIHKVMCSQTYEGTYCQ